MDFIRNFLSSLIILVAVPLLLVGTLSFIIRQTILSEQYVGRQLDNPRIYDVLANFIFQAVDHGGQNEAVKAAIVKEITPDRVKEVVQPAVRNLFQFFQSDTGGELIIDLTPLKTPMLAVLPASERQESSEVIPDTINLTEKSQPTSSTPDSKLAGYKTWYQRFQKAGVYLPLIVLGLLALLFLINTGRRRLWRPGYAVFVAGLVLSALGGMATFGLPSILQRLSNSGAELPPQIQEAASDLARTVGGDIARWILFFGVGYVVAAIVFFVLAFILFRENTAGPESRVKEDRPLAGHT